MPEKTYLELIVKDNENIILKTYEDDAIPVMDLISALSLWKDDPQCFGLLLRALQGVDASERSVVIEF